MRAGMNGKELAPYIVPLVAVALLGWRLVRAQRSRTIRPGRLWVLPAFLLTMTGLTLAKEPAPTLTVIAAFLLAAAAGGALGWFRVHTLEFSVDSETNAITSKSTPLGAVILVALLLFRYAIKYVLHDEGVRGVELVRWTDGALIFSASMLIAQSAHTWVRARRLLPPPAPVSGPSE